MSAHLRLLRGQQITVDVGHDVLRSELMFSGGHGITFTRAGTGRSSTVLSAMRARNSRERTVLSGSRFEPGDLLISQFVVFTQHQNLAIVDVELTERGAHDQRHFRIAGTAAAHLDLAKISELVQGLSSLREQQVVGDGKQIGAEGSRG